MSGQMLTVKQVAIRINVSPGAIYKLVNSGALSHYRIGTTIRISEGQLDDWLTAVRCAATDRVTKQSFSHLDL